jgi:phosphosulfolactate synthase (CoM biosynthesis protein A)
MVKEDQVQKAVDILKDLELSFTFGGLLSENEKDED